jgi:hypothetical protein
MRVGKRVNLIAPLFQQALHTLPDCGLIVQQENTGGHQKPQESATRHEARSILYHFSAAAAQSNDLDFTGRIERH